MRLAEGGLKKQKQTKSSFFLKKKHKNIFFTLTYLLTYFLTHPSRGDSLWPAFAGTEAGQGLLCRRRSHPSHPTRDPGLSTALLSRSTLEHAITHSATPHLRPTHTRSLSNSSTLLSTRPCRAPVPPTLAPPTSLDLQSPPPRH